MRQLLKVLLTMCVVVAAGAFAAVALAAPTGRITPYAHCTDGAETIPAGQELVVRSAWSTSNSGQMERFLAYSRITWSVYSADGTTLLASSAPGYGDRTYWSTPVEGTGTIDGVERKRFSTTYLAPTGITLASGQSVLLTYSWDVAKKVDDGFGHMAEGVIASTTNCVITGA